MRKIRHVLWFSGLLAMAFVGGRSLVLAQAAQDSQSSALVGTWRLVEFWDRETPTSSFVYRYGRTPTGYFTYDPTGHMSIQIMRGPDSFRVDSARGEQWFEKASVEELRRATEDYRAYFGTYIVDSAKGTVVHRVEGDSRGLYTGTEQRRTYRLTGDRLMIGDGVTALRVLVRVR